MPRFDMFALSVSVRSVREFAKKKDKKHTISERIFGAAKNAGSDHSIGKTQSLHFRILAAGVCLTGFLPFNLPLLEPQCIHSPAGSVSMQIRKRLCGTAVKTSLSLAFSFLLPLPPPFLFLIEPDFPPLEVGANESVAQA